MKTIVRYKYLLIALIYILNISPLLAQQKGKASYYSNRLHGARMSDGTKYHRDSMTCAHLRYPLGTILKVTNLNNQKTVIVKVTDRGPHGRGRIIDLSYAAAKQIGMISAGIVMVKIEPYKGDLNIPYKTEQSTSLPQFDFEFASKENLYESEWQAEWAQKHKTAPATLKEDEISQMKKDNQPEKKENKTIKAEHKVKSTNKEATSESPTVSSNRPHKASLRHKNN